MTKSERQQSLTAARNAVHFLRLYIESQIVDDQLRAEITCLLDEFTRLDQSSRRPNAGRPMIENPSPRTLSQRRYRSKAKENNP